MSKLSVIKIYPENYMYKNFCLHQKAEDVSLDEFGTKQLKDIIVNMFDTLYDYPSGVGLAANQIGLLKRICVIDYKRDGKKPLVCINPEYIPLVNEKVISKEQCISFPNVSVTLERYSKIKVTYQDYYGVKKEIVAEGFKAFVLQHEINHLSGKVFIDDEHKIEPYDGYSMQLSMRAMEVVENG